MATAIKRKPRKPTGYQARPWLKLVPRVQATTDNRARLYLPSGVLTLDQEIVASPITMSLDEAATVTFTVADPSGTLNALALASTDERQLMSGVDVRWRRIWWRITRIERDEQAWIVVCEDRVAAYLRSHRRVVTASRNKTTRAAFVYRLAKGVKAGGGIPVYIPELREKQGIYKPKEPKAKRAAKSEAVDTSGLDGTVWGDQGGGSSSGGWGDAASKIKVKRQTANSTQLQTINAALSEAQELGASERVMVAVVMTITQESNAGMVMGGNSIAPDVRGAFQQRTYAQSGWTRSERSAMDTRASTRRFLNGGDLGAPGWKQKFGSVQASVHAGLNLGGMINMVQVAGPAAPAQFQQWEREARATVKLWLDRNRGGGSSATAFAASGPEDADRYYRGQYKFRTSTGEPMDHWESSGELAAEVNWHRWAVCNTLGFATDGEMIRGNAVLRISRDLDAVHSLRWTWDTRREASSLTARVALTDPFAVLPGMVAMVDDEAPASGRWLVESIDVDPAQSNIAEITYRRPGAKLLEPAPELKLRKESARTIGGKGDYGVFGDDGKEEGAPGTGDVAGPPSPGSGDVVSRTYAAALQISRQTPGYLYGGGHGPKIETLRGSQGLDCSSSSSLALYKAGAFTRPTAIVSGQFATSWGQPGRGKRMTIWANAEHVWIEFHEKTYEYSRFDTSGQGEGRRGDGPKMRRSRRTDQSRFTPRHWPGT